MRLFSYQITRQEGKTIWFDLDVHPNKSFISALKDEVLVNLCQTSLELIYKAKNRQLELKKKQPIKFEVISAEIKGSELIVKTK